VLLFRKSKEKIHYLDDVELQSIGSKYELGAGFSSKLMLLTQKSFKQLRTDNPIPDMDEADLAHDDFDDEAQPHVDLPQQQTLFYEDIDGSADGHTHDTNTPSVTVTGSNTSSRANSAFISKENEFQRKMTQKISGLVHAIKQVSS
jgi:hypothetical protein